MVDHSTRRVWALEGIESLIIEECEAASEHMEDLVPANSPSPRHPLPGHLLPFSLFLPQVGGTVVKNPPANAGDMGSVPGFGRSSGA